MTIRRFAPALLPFACIPANAWAANHTFLTSYDNVLGTSLDLKVGARNQYFAARASHAVLEEVARQSRILSAWDPASEFSRWARTYGQPVRISPELFHVLDLFDQWRGRTDGALNPGAQAAIHAWTSAAAQGREPTTTELQAAVRAAGEPHWSLDRANLTATRVSDTPLVLASFAKSYIAGRAANAALDLDGVRSVVLNAGGDIVVRGDAAESVAIANPRDDAENADPLSVILVRDRTVATSGDYRRGFDVGAARYSHIVDPRTGRPAGDVISSTVVSPDAVDAGALATALSILPARERQRLASSIDGVEYLLVAKDGTVMTSPGWRALELANTKPAATPRASVAVSALQGLWDPSMELAVNFELPLLGGPAKRPFVAIWIEDADKFPVRTLALWYHEDRYLTEMKAWYRADRLRSMSENTSIARTVGAATRPPGKYTVKWDGKDSAGKPVKGGTYTVYLEVSREHGTYQLLKQQMTFTGTPQQVQLPGGTEVAGASFDYHKTPQ